MNIPNKLNIGTRFSIVLLTLLMTATLVSAQRSTTTKTLEAIGVDIEQCANGPLSAPINCNVSSGNDGYTRGNLIASKSHYFEGDSVPIRIVATGLEIGQQYTVTIGYDFTKGGKYATDYLTDYDRTESVNNDPCVGVTGCLLASEQTIGIPTDPQVTAGFDGILGTADDITQIGGSFSCFGCTFVSVSGYSLSGSTASDSSKSITLTFTANQTSVVIAYGSHISTRSDWGLQNSAISISGSPYHNFIIDFPGANSGSRDLQLSADAVIFPAIVTIIKVANPYTGTGASDQLFRFTASSNFGTTEFFLQDNNNNGDGNADNIVQNVTDFTNAITVTEDTNIGGGWSLANLQCVEADGGLGFSANSSPQPPGTTGPTATILAQEGELITCTFTNNQQQPTAAPVSLSGRVMNAFGRGISGVTLTLTDLETGSYRVVNTNTFGYYTFSDLPAGQFYELKIRSKRYSFPEPTRYFTLNEDAFDVNFVANP